MKKLNNINSITNGNNSNVDKLIYDNVHFCKECTTAFYPLDIEINLLGSLAKKYCPECIDRYSTCTQWCNCCDYEVELLNRYEVQQCPTCENEIYPCSLCNSDEVTCSKCQFNINVTVDRAMKNVISGYLIKDSNYEYINIKNTLHYRKIGSNKWLLCNIGLNPFNKYTIVKK